MNFYEISAVIATILIVISGPPYVVDIFRGRTKPQRMTWFIFSFLSVIAIYIQFEAGARLSLIYLVLEALGTIFLFILSIKFGVGGFSKPDKIALGTCVLGIVISVVIRQPIVALIGVIIADASGMILTITKSYKVPESEMMLSWFIGGTASIFALLSLEKWSLLVALYPAYLILAHYAVPVSQILGKMKRRALRP